MHVYRSIDDFTPPREGMSIFIGKADALHLGHIALISEMLQLSEKLGSKAGILSLIPDASNPIFDSESLRFILTEEERQSFLSNWPIDYLIYQKMTREFTSIAPNDFVTQILVDKLAIRGVVVGWDFKFGLSRGGDTELLARLSPELGFRLRIIKPVMVDDRPVKTTLIRELLDMGKVRDAWRLLGYPFFVSGIVVEGKGLGHPLGFPTANIQVPPEKILPRKGVYIGRALFDDTCKWGLINVGTRPTVSDEEKINVEIWLKDFSDELYGSNIKIEFFTFIREEKKFSSMDELKIQVEKDKRDLESFIGM